MKEDIHPEYREVVFVDTGSGEKFLCKSTIATSETIQYEGRELPVYTVSVSSKSHPFFTGDQKFIDTEGRVDKFKRRYARSPIKKTEEKKEEKEAPAKKAAVKKTADKPKKPAAKPKKAAKEEKPKKG